MKLSNVRGSEVGECKVRGSKLRGRYVGGRWGEDRGECKVRGSNVRGVEVRGSEVRGM